MGRCPPARNSASSSYFPQETLPGPRAFLGCWELMLESEGQGRGCLELNEYTLGQNTSLPFHFKDEKMRAWEGRELAKITPSG